MAIDVRAYHIYEKGKYRSNQEDYIFPMNCSGDTQERLFILCDGMGGHERGEVASKTVCDVLCDYFGQNLSPEQDLQEDLIVKGVEKSLSVLDNLDGGEAKKMGTTMVLLRLNQSSAIVAHVGDSRLYHIRPEEGNPSATEILHKTRDHSLVNDLVRLGEMTEEEARTSKQKNVLTRALMAKMNRIPKIEFAHITDIKSGDYFFICSDGMLEMLEDSNLRFIFSKAGASDQQKVEMLIGASLESRDNHSAHVIHII